MSKWAFFTDTEVAGLDTELVSKLDYARKIAGIPFHLTSTTGGTHAANSTHYKGLAVDIGLGHLEAGFPRNTVRWAMLKGLFAAGFERIECAPLHVHVDIGKLPDYPTPLFWVGTDS